MAALNAARRGSRTACATRAPSTSRRSARTSTPSACRTGSSPALVRGLDYYTRTAFEFYISGREGQQQALGGGGRYDGLVELLGGRPTPGIGFGIGLDRLVLALEEQGGGDLGWTRRPTVVVVGADPDDTVTPPAHRHGAARGRRDAPGPSSAGASSASSSSRRRGSTPTSRSSSATSWPPAMSSSGTCRPGRHEGRPGRGSSGREVARAHAAHRHGRLTGSARRHG